jgi:hypothetical protein
MIVIEIDEETGTTHLEILGISKSDLEGIDDKTQTIKVNDAARRVRKPFQSKAQLNKEAAESLDRINQAATILKDKNARKKYLEELQQGKTGSLDVLRVERTSPAFFWDRAVRFRAIAQALRDQGWTGSLLSDGTP